MVWKKLNDFVEMWEEPVLGTEDQKDGKRFMALCVDPSSNKPFLGVARQVTERIGNQDVYGYIDRSKLVIVESSNLLDWKVKKSLVMKNIDKQVNELTNEESNFTDLEDPDIIIDNKGIKHIYFTVPIRYKNKDWHLYIGHASGKNIESLESDHSVIGKINEEILGFKEVCPVPIDEKNLIMAETWIYRGKERQLSAISLIESKSSSEKWEFKKIIHDPEKEVRNWCSGYSSPCRIFNQSFLTWKGYLVGIMNGREKTKIVNGIKMHGKFRPGLFLFDKESEEIIWIDDKPLFEDPIATTITFASDLVYLNDKEVILYAHPNDSFVRAYKLKAAKIKKLLPKSI